ncbi:unnamed protein product [Amoebophrya sp. A120]|nr:unnamed protein product [Amoebophrya sp. A120]|eukprot:GSA120T00010720001.1
MNTTRDVIERYQQKIQVFKKLREFRHHLANASLLRNKSAKCTVLEVESMWISLFGTTAVSCDILQFIHALDTCGGWGKEMSLKDKALFFKLVAARNGECSFQTFLESPVCFVPYVATNFNATSGTSNSALSGSSVMTNTQNIKVDEAKSLEQVVQDLARSVVYRKVDLLRLDMFSSGYVSAEELQIITPKLYPLHLLKAAMLELLTSFCEKQNIILAETTMDLSFNQKRTGATRVLPTDGPWFLRYVIQACELFDRRLVFHKYLRDPTFQDIYKQVQNAPLEDEQGAADADPGSAAGDLGDNTIRRPKMPKEAGNMLFMTGMNYGEDPLAQRLREAEQLWLQDALDTNRTEQSFRDFVTVSIVEGECSASVDTRDYRKKKFRFNICKIMVIRLHHYKYPNARKHFLTQQTGREAHEGHPAAISNRGRRSEPVPKFDAGSRGGRGAIVSL